LGAAEKIFHSVEKWLPRMGEFSIVWKKVFHGVEKFGFGRRIFSTQWKKFA
jgi:hypothetical protein